MPKVRAVHPDFWTDEDVLDLTPLARLLFIGMWNFACDNGHLDDKPKQIRMRILPGDECDIDALIHELVKVGLVERGEGFLKVPKLPTRQRIDLRFLTLCDHCAPDEHTAYSEDDRKGRAPQTRRAPAVRTSSTRRVHADDGDVDGDGDGDGGAGGSSPSTSPKTSSTKNGRKRPARAIPEDWTPTEKHQQYADERGIDLIREAFQFRNHAASVDRRCVNWNAAFTNWLAKARPAPRPASGPRREGWWN